MGKDFDNPFGVTLKNGNSKNVTYFKHGFFLEIKVDH